MKQKDFDLEYRKYVIGGVAALIVFIYIIRLFMLQITSDDYKKSADSNAFLKKIEYPSRGAILDRKGKLLVYNQPSYDTATRQYTVQWTWVLYEEKSYYADEH